MSERTYGPPRDRRAAEQEVRHRLMDSVVAAYGWGYERASAYVDDLLRAMLEPEEVAVCCDGRPYRSDGSYCPDCGPVPTPSKEG